MKADNKKAEYLKRKAKHLAARALRVWKNRKKLGKV